MTSTKHFVIVSCTTLTVWFGEYLQIVLFNANGKGCERVTHRLENQVEAEYPLLLLHVVLVESDQSIHSKWLQKKNTHNCTDSTVHTILFTLACA